MVKATAWPDDGDDVAVSWVVAMVMQSVTEAVGNPSEDLGVHSN